MGQVKWFQYQHFVEQAKNYLHLSIRKGLKKAEKQK
jgi:hypothetical protein